MEGGGGLTSLLLGKPVRVNLIQTLMRRIAPPICGPDQPVVVTINTVSATDPNDRPTLSLAKARSWRRRARRVRRREGLRRAYHDRVLTAGKTAMRDMSPERLPTILAAGREKSTESTPLNPKAATFVPVPLWRPAEQRPLFGRIEEEPQGKAVGKAKADPSGDAHRSQSEEGRLTVLLRMYEYQLQGYRRGPFGGEGALDAKLRLVSELANCRQAVLALVAEREEREKAEREEARRQEEVRSARAERGRWSRMGIQATSPVTPGGETLEHENLAYGETLESRFALPIGIPAQGESREARAVGFEKREPRLGKKWTPRIDYGDEVGEPAKPVTFRKKKRPTVTKESS